METNTIRVVVVDDEPHAIETLSTHLGVMNELNVVGTAANALDGFRLISKQKPDIAFLDIQLPQHNGIELAEVLRTSHPETRVIFVTAHSEFTLQALRASAFDFILKPVSRDELSAAIQRYKDQREQEKTPLKNSLSDKTNHPTRVALKMKNTIRYVDASDIALVKADGNYSDIFLSDGQKIYISQSIGQFQLSLPAGDFVKVSRSALINTKYVRELNRKCRKVVLKVDQQLLDVVVARDHFKEVEDLLG